MCVCARADQVGDGAAGHVLEEDGELARGGAELGAEVAHDVGVLQPGEQRDLLLQLHHLLPARAAARHGHLPPPVERRCCCFSLCMNMMMMMMMMMMMI